MTGAYFADGTQHLDYDTFQEHIAPNTTSDFAFKGALRDEATTVWRGMIRVERDDYNIAPVHLADAIEELVRRSQQSLSDDRSPAYPYDRSLRA